MKIILDTEVCKKDGKDIDVILYLLSLLADCKITYQTFEKARQQGLLKFDKPYNRRELFPDYVSLSNTGEYIAESIIATSNGGVESEDRFTHLAEELRKLFPAGKKPGYAYTWRDSVSCIADRLKKFTVKYGEYSDEQIIETTKRYVNSFNGDYKYMQLLKYFIWKNKVTAEEMVNGRLVGEVEKQSQLAAWLDDKEEKQTVTDWDVVLK